jgi:adenine-specific DNA-methyltransferase
MRGYATPSRSKVQGLGGDFTYARLGDRLLREYRNFGEPPPAYEDLAKYVWFTDTSQAFDAKGLNRKTGRIGEWRDTAYYLLYSPDGSGRTALDREFLASLEKERRPRRVVYCEKIWLHRDEIPRNVVPMLVPFQLKA